MMTDPEGGTTATKESSQSQVASGNGSRSRPQSVVVADQPPVVSRTKARRSQRRVAPRATPDYEKIAQARHRCIVISLLFISVCAVAAVVIPLVLKECYDCTPADYRTTVPPAFAPTLAPSSSSTTLR